jgi:hypothetical protein
MKDYYNILGVASGASQAEIKTAYRQLAIQFHPDKNGGDKACEERFKEISAAYVIVGDVAKRNAYDFTRGYHKNYYGQNPASGAATPATYLILLKSIKNKVFNAGGYINQAVLFKVIDDILTDDTIAFLVNTGQVNTNNLIIDEVLVCCVFLDDALKSALHKKLLRLSDGDQQFVQKLTLLNTKTDYSGKVKPPENTTAQPTTTSLLLFVVIIILLVIILFQAVAH